MKHTQPTKQAMHMEVVEEQIHSLSLPRKIGYFQFGTCEWITSADS